MKVLINYADEAYRKTQKFNTITGKIICGFDKVIEYSPEDIDNEFYEQNVDILSRKRGNGLWLWKPYFIYKTMLTLDDGDYLFYCDSGAFFIKRIDGLIKSMNNEDIWLYGLPLIEKQFTKPELFAYMDCNDNKYKETNQFSGTFMLFKISDKSKKFVKEWLEYCKTPGLLSPETICNSEGFIAHREDQSIISLLAKKYNITMHKDPSQYGKLPEKYKSNDRIFKKIKSDDRYGPVLIHHRTPKVKFSVCLRQVLCAVLPYKVGIRLVKH